MFVCFFTATVAESLILVLLVFVIFFFLWSQEPAALWKEDGAAEDKIYSYLEAGDENEKEKWEIKQDDDDHFQKKYELLKSASLDSVVIEVKSESGSEPQPLTQETRALTASELLLNK